MKKLIVTLLFVAACGHKGTHTSAPLEVEGERSPATVESGETYEATATNNRKFEISRNEVLRLHRSLRWPENTTGAARTLILFDEGNYASNGVQTRQMSFNQRRIDKQYNIIGYSFDPITNDPVFDVQLMTEAPARRNIPREQFKLSNAMFSGSLSHVFPCFLEELFSHTGPVWIGANKNSNYEGPGSVKVLGVAEVTKDLDAAPSLILNLLFDLRYKDNSRNCPNFSQRR